MMRVKYDNFDEIILGFLIEMAANVGNLRSLAALRGVGKCIGARRGQRGWKKMTQFFDMVYARFVYNDDDKSTEL